MPETNEQLNPELWPMNDMCENKGKRFPWNQVSDRKKLGSDKAKHCGGKFELYKRLRVPEVIPICQCQ